MNWLQQLVAARWFPTVSKPLLTGLVASGIVYGLHALGITNIVPTEVNAAAAPLVGFLIAAIVQKSGGSTPAPGPAPAPSPAPEPQGASLGQQVAQTLLGPVAQAIDADPSAAQALAIKYLEQVTEQTGQAHLPQT